MKKQLSIFEEQEHPMVRMHNDLITAHFGHLELNSMRIFLLMLAKLNYDATDLSPILINLHDVIPNYSGGRNFELIEKAIIQLKTKMKDVKINTVVKGKKAFVSMTVIDNIKYVEDSDYLEANFGIAIRPFLIQLKGDFTLAELRELLKLKSTYTIRFYMLVRSLYVNQPSFYTTIGDLRSMFFGDELLYPEYKDFKKYIIKANQKALEKTSSAFDFEEEKKGRSVHAITITAKHLRITGEKKKHVLSGEIVKALAEHKVNTSKINEMVTNGAIDEPYIKYVIKILSDPRKRNKIEKLGGAIFTAVTEKHLWEEYKVHSKPKELLPQPEPVNTPNESIHITMDQATIMHAEALSSGETKYPFAGFVRGLKMRNIIVDGFRY